MNTETKKRIAVHYNFQAKCLSVREIRTNGTLGKLLALRADITLEDAEFTVDQKKLSNWRNGSKHVRQFAEVRGIIVPLPAKLKNSPWNEIVFNPHLHDHFKIASTGHSIGNAPYVWIKGKQIYALMPDLYG